MFESDQKEQIDYNGNGTGAIGIKNNYVPNIIDAEDPKRLIPQLCNHFYHLGWASGKRDLDLDSDSDLESANSNCTHSSS